MIPWANPLLQNVVYRDEIRAAIDRVYNSGNYINGTEVSSFESSFATFLSVQYGVAVASGTDALHLSLRALGIGSGDEVITVSHTAVATVAAIELAGATPVLVDIEPKYYTIDPEQIERAISKKTKAIIPVHLYGQPSDLSSLKAICERLTIHLIEDCCQSHGAEYQGKKTGTFGDLACFSFYPTKNLGAIGDGGMIMTTDKDLAEKCRRLREYGWKDRFKSLEPGFNSRLDEIQAAVLSVKLKYLDSDNLVRRNIAGFYQEKLSSLPIELPQVRQNCRHAFHLYVIGANDRDELRNELFKCDILTGVHYPLPVHLQPAYKGRIKKFSMAETERLSARILSLPIYPGLSDSQMERVVSTLKQWCDSQL